MLSASCISLLVKVLPAAAWRAIGFPWLSCGLHGGRWPTSGTCTPSPSPGELCSPIVDLKTNKQIPTVTSTVSQLAFFFQHIDPNVCLLYESQVVSVSGSTDAVVMV